MLVWSQPTRNINIPISSLTTSVYSAADRGDCGLWYKLSVIFTAVKGKNPKPLPVFAVTIMYLAQLKLYGASYFFF